ncbi:hypothetical protein RDWZM_004189 [Blomia tropicalis]|uniref:Gamma-aminobutyric acid receptor alpha-like n=1 Tax=Blomia tropicalis TaxID=40697 RepID=A0A9Q0MH03_BLOTA|nr:hypothetical protein RDWZM_004189 [Blomia tropicalis]
MIKFQELLRQQRRLHHFIQTKMLRNNTKQSADSKEATKNISLVLAALLDNYDYNQRPSYGGPPAVITTNLEIRSMGPISELDMEYSLDCYFRQKWQDERLRFTGSANFLSLNIKMLDKIWKPDTYFHTGKGSHLHMITTPNKFLRIYKNGFILYSMRLTIKSLCPMDLHSFPMDKQSCPLILGSYGYPNDQLLYNWDENPVTFNKKDFTLSQFDIVKTISRNGTFSFKRGNHSMLQVNFNLRRHVGYFLIQIYVPCSLIVVLSWVSFWINREATADRVGLGVTAVLTLSTFGLDSRSDLPRVSYATALDWYTIMCFLFVVFTLLEFAGVHYFTKVGTGEVPFFEIEEDLSPNSSEDESILPLSLQKNKWKGAVRQLKRNSLKRSVKNRNYYTRNSKLYGRCSPLPTEFEMKSSNYIKVRIVLSIVY